MTKNSLRWLSLFAIGAVLVTATVMLGDAGTGGDMVMAMAVVTKYGTGYKDPTSLKAIEGIQRAAEGRTIRSLISITNGDSIASKFFIGSLPSNAKLNPGGTLYFDAITGATDCDVGLAYPNGGATIVVDCIVNGHDIHTAGSTTLAAATGSGVATATNMEKAAWELAGLSSDPGGELDLILTLNAAATATGKVLAHLPYSKGV